MPYRRFIYFRQQIDYNCKRMSQQTPVNPTSQPSFSGIDQTTTLNGTIHKKSSANSQQNSQRQSSLIIRHYLRRTRYVILLELLLILIAGSVCLLHRQQTITSPDETNDNKIVRNSIVGSRLPKILWLYTYHQLEGQSAMTKIQAQYFKNMGNINNYDVRIVNSWTAYDYLSNGTIANITATMQKVKINETVCNLLKLALLKQHGGIMLSNFNMLMTNTNFNWLESMFSPISQNSTLRIDPTQAQIYIPTIYPTGQYSNFNEHFIAAVPNSKLITDTFVILQKAIITGRTKNNQLSSFFKQQPITNIQTLPYSIASIMTVLMHQLVDNPSIEPYRYYGIQNKKQKNIVNLKDMPTFQASRLLKDRGSPVKGIDLIFDTYDLVKDIVDALLINNYRQPIEQGSIISHLLYAPQNYKILLKPPVKKQVNMCIVYIDGSNARRISGAIDVFKGQRYDQKQVVIFSNNGREEKSDRITIIKDSGNQLRNLEIALTQHCQAKSYAIIMKSGNTFNKETALQRIASTVQDPNIISANINLVLDNKLHKTDPKHNVFFRSKDADNIQNANQLLNHMRVISVDAFRYIPQFQLRDAYGVYFEDRFVVLATFLEMIVPNNTVRSAQLRHNIIYMKKAYSDAFHFPNKIGLIESTVFIHTESKEQVNESTIKRLKIRAEVESIDNSLLNCHKWKIPFRKQLVYNKGETYTPMDKKEGYQLIPKIIHQTWLGDSLPQANQYLIQKVKRLHPDYQVLLWTDKNITYKNFPVSHSIMNTMLNVYRTDETVNFDKLVLVRDLLRNQIMYRFGGFWRDAGMNHFKAVFDQFRKYRLVVGAQNTFTHRWRQGVHFFGNEPGSEYMKRLSDYRNVNRIGFYSTSANSITSFTNYRQVSIGDEQNNPQVLILHHQYYYPKGDLPTQSDLCLKKEENILPGQSVQLKSKDHSLMANCQTHYPQAYGMVHKILEMSWHDQQ